MALPIVLEAEPIISILFLLFLWMLVGVFWVYRDAKRRGLPSPVWRGAIWGWFGVVGAYRHLLGDRPLNRTRLRWLGVSILLLLLWAALLVGSQRWPGRGWAIFVAALFVLYWQFSRKPADSAVAESERK